MARTRLVMLLGAATLVAGACSPAAPAAADDALRQDLDAARAHVTAAPPSRTQFVSPLELGHAVDAPARSAPRVAAAGPAPVHPTARRTPTPVTRVAHVSRPSERAPAPAQEIDAPPATERATDAPSIDVEVAPLPEPARDEPVVAAPTRRPADVPTPSRRGRVWTTGDVIRNAPFPINP